MDHPFLNNDFHIRWSSLNPANIETDINLAINQARSAVEAIALDRNSTALNYENTFNALEEALEPLQRAWGLVTHLDSVCNTSELRSAYNKMIPVVSAFFAGIPLNKKLWECLQKCASSSSADNLSATKQRHIQETLADFKEQGANLPIKQKQRASEIQEQLAKHTQKYSENCLDAMNAWELIINDEATLAGLPESARGAALQSAKEAGYSEGIWRFSLDAPSYIAVMTYAESPALRKDVWLAYANIGREAPYDNSALVLEILELRHEFAKIMGKDNFADYVTARRMAGSGQVALNFGESIFDRVETAFRAEDQTLRQYKSITEETSSSLSSLPLLEPWDVAYWAEKQREKNYDFNEESLRPYFPIDKVVSGLFTITEELFGLRIKACDTVEVWHPQVKFYELFDANSNVHLGSFYADWYPRRSKRGGAWMNHLRTGERKPDKHSPHLGLICGNLSPPIGQQPALLSHREVETIFHEFGHLLHHLCGEVEVKSLNGINVPWDFVELPSQMLENWCWERASLDRFARHYKTNELIPQALFDNMRTARNYRKASATARQLALGKMDLDLHINWPNSNKTDLDNYIKKKLKAYTLSYATQAQSNVFNFSHLFSSPTGYAAGYYSYKWAEVLDADAFTRFQAEGILSSDTGRDFRDQILSKGNAAAPATLFKKFMGRDPDPEALLRRDGLVK